MGIMERGLPSSIEAERAVLGSILLEPSLYAEAAARLTPADFTIEAHRRIFLAMGAMAERGTAIDAITLCEELGRLGDLDAVGGVTAVADLTQSLPRYEHIDSYVAAVSDKAMLRRMIVTAQKIAATCIEGASDPREIIAQAERAVLRVGESAIRGSGLSLADAVEQYRGGWQVLMNPSSAARGIQTHIDRYNTLTGGLHPGELTIVGGRPSQGKTAFALGVALRAARDGRPVVVFSLEMSKESIIGRLACMLAHVDSHAYRMGHLGADERRSISRALGELVRLPMVVDDGAVTNVQEIGAKLRREKQRRGLDLAIIDYLGLIQSAGRTENRNQEVSAISRALKLMARDLDVPVLALSQLSRDNEKLGGGRRPQLSDLRDSGSLEQDADVVVFPYRESEYKPDRADLAGVAELIIRKQRNGPTGIVKTAWVAKYSGFENLREGE